MLPTRWVTLYVEVAIDSKFVYQFVVLLYFGKSAINPIIYGWKNHELRITLVRSLWRDGTTTSELLRRTSTVIQLVTDQTTLNMNRKACDPESRNKTLS